MTLSEEHGSPYLLAWGTLLHGWALAEQGQWRAGIGQLQQGLAAHRATGGETLRPYFLALLAEAYGQSRQVDNGLAAITEALDLVNATGERFYEAEVYRIKGELTLQQERHRATGTGQQGIGTGARSLMPDAQGEAEGCFLKAIAIAQKQQAKSLELRAVMSLARLWRQQGKKAEARHRLAEIYWWFTEGFDTKDLQDAKALIEKLHR
jgi:predicted ATPase